MKSIVVSLLMMLSMSMLAQDGEVKSNVYKVEAHGTGTAKKYVKNELLKGATRDLAYLETNTITLGPGKAKKSSHGEKMHSDLEEFIIIKEGKLKVTIKGESKILGPGSLALFLPGDEHAIENGGDIRAAYYVMKYKSKAPVNIERGRSAGGSFMIDWNDIAFKENAKGGRRNFFERATAMFERFELHTTMLNEGLSSHNPHKHRAEENVILIRGEATMQIGETQHEASQGDLIFLASEVLHALTNTGKGPCEYFAIQWQ